MTDTMASSLHTLQSMSHLEELRQETEAAQKAAQNAAVSSEAPPTAVIDDPREEKIYGFDIAYKGPRNQVTKGRFSNQILTVGQKITVGVMRARLQMGVSLEAMSADTYNLLFMVTWLQQSLVEKPKWADDLLALESEGLVRAIFDQVDGHERYFRGESSDAETSQAEV